jgi:hypothetical protein
VLEPVIGDATTISRQIFEGIQTVEVVDRYLRHSVGFGEAQVDGNATPAIVIRLPRSPESYAAANRAEMKFDRFSSNV